MVIRQLFMLACLLLVLLLNTVVLAQEGTPPVEPPTDIPTLEPPPLPTETPLPPPTETPFPTATETAIPTQTPLPTNTDTAVPTLTPTDTETATWTPTLTFSATETATLADLTSSMLLEEATATPTATATATPCPFSYAFNFRDAPLSLITIEPYTLNDTDYYGTYEAGQGYKYIEPYVWSGGRWHSGISLRIQFAQPLPLASFRLWTEAPLYHSLILYATDGTSIASSHQDHWYRAMGWGSGLTKEYTHAIFVGSIPGPAGGYVRDLDFTLRTCANPFPEQSLTPPPTATPTGTAEPGICLPTGGSALAVQAENEGTSTPDPACVNVCTSIPIVSLNLRSTPEFADNILAPLIGGQLTLSDNSR